MITNSGKKRFREVEKLEYIFTKLVITNSGKKRFREVEKLEVVLFPESIRVGSYWELSQGRGEVGDIREGDQIQQHR